MTDGAASIPARGRRVGGRDALIDAAGHLVAGATLDDVAGLLGTRRLARAAGVTPTSVTPHFPGSSQALACMAHWLHDDAGAVAASEAELTEAFEAFAAGSNDAMELISGAAHDLLADNIADVVLRAAAHLAFLVAPSDDDVAALLGEFYGSVLERTSTIYAAFARATGRRFDEEAGYSPESVSVLITALADGLISRSSFDADRVDPALFAETVIRIFDSATVVGRRPYRGPSARLLAEAQRRSPGVAEIDRQSVARVLAAALDIYDESGWRAVWQPAVAGRAGVTQPAVEHAYDTRNALGAAMWAARHLDRIELAATADEPDDGALGRHVARVVDAAAADPELAATVVAAHLERLAAFKVPSTARRGDQFDRVVDVLVDVVARCGADGDVDADLVTSGAFQAAITDRHAPVGEVAQRLLAASRAPSPPGPGDSSR